MMKIKTLLAYIKLASPWRLLSIAAIVLGGMIVGTIGASWLRGLLPADQIEEYNVETARQVTSFSSTDAFVTTFQNRLLRSPDDPHANEQLAAAFIQKARETGDPAYYTKADALLQKALSLSPNDFDSMSASGALALSRHQFQDGLEWGERARLINPYNANNYGVIGDAEIELGRYDDAVKTFQTMVNIRPDLSSYSRVSYARELTGDRPGAIQAMQQAIRAGGPNAENTNWVRVQLGNLYFDQGDLAEAEHQYQAALFDFPDYPYALAGLGNVRAAQGDYSGAITEYTPAVNRMPLPQFVIALGDIYAAAGQPAQAAQQYDLVGVEEKLYAANGVDLDAEMSLFDADHNRNLSTVLDRARAAYARRPSITVADILAWTLYKTGDYASADQMMQTALRLGTQSPLMDYHAGMIAYQLGRYDDARTYLDKIEAMNPHFSLLYQDQAKQLYQQLQARPASPLATNSDSTQERP
jgi:tetratricopeptide (TPR) repeat protein